MWRVALVICVLVGAASAEDTAPPSPYELAEAGDSYRVESRHGVIHVFIPNGYDRATRATILYVHGYYTDLDTAWREYRLAEQFAASGINAAFVACSAPASDGEPVAWPSAAELVRTASAAIDRELGGRTIAVAHSGGHRTVQEWLDEPTLDSIVLLDGAYGDPRLYQRWLRLRRDRRLVSVGDLLHTRAKSWARGIKGAVTLDQLPTDAIPEDARRAPLLYIHSTEGHMELVTRGVALPTVLRALDVPSIVTPPIAPLS